MATTGFWPVRGKLKKVLDYADNPDKTTSKEYLDEDLYQALRYTENDNKTDEKKYVSGVNCSAAFAYEEMMAVKQKYGERGKVVAYHGYQSFKTDELTPEQCHAIGIETAKRMWGKDYQVLVTTHLNTDNLHNHSHCRFRGRNGSVLCVGIDVCGDGHSGPVVADSFFCRRG